MKRSALFRYQIISIMICFYVMGAIEMVGIASNYIKVNLHINDAKANLIPSLVYIWFLICTIPVGMLMTKIGRKSTVIISMSLMFIAMFIALFSNSYAFMLICFILLGIGDVSMQTSLYPLLSNVISGKRLAENLTVGQFVKTLSSFSAPYVAMIGSVYFLHFFNLGWRMLFVFYMIFTIIGITMLSFARIERQIESDRAVSFIECFRLLKDKFILFAFLGVMCHVGIDISTNTIAPKLLMYRLDIILDKASFAASLYFIARLFGCLFWSFFLNKVSRKIFFYISILMILVSYVGLYFADTKLLIFIFIALIGIGNANLFPVLFSLAVQSKPEEENRISVLMIMGQAGGAFFPYFMGLAFDKAGLDGSISVIMIAVVYLMFFSIKLKNKIVLK